jgi:hypothetical protein
MFHELLDVAQSAQGLGLMLMCSHNSNLSTQLKDFAHMAWISQREVGENSNGWEPAPPKGGGTPVIPRYEN